MSPRVTHTIAWIVVVAGTSLLAIHSSTARGQQPPNFDQSNSGRVNLYDVNGHPIVNPATETEGFPLFLPHWKQGWLRLADNEYFANVPLELDLVRQEVYYRRPDGSELQVDPGQVKQVAIVDTVAGSTVLYQFESGFQPIDNQSATSFYLVLDSGRVVFLESMRKRLLEEKDEMAGTDEKEYRLYNDFYVFSQGRIERVKKDPKFFLQLTGDKHDQMEAFIEKNKLSFRSPEDIRQFIHYYNGLP